VSPSIEPGNTATPYLFFTAESINDTSRMRAVALWISGSEMAGSNFEHDETTAAARRTIKFTLDE